MARGKDKFIERLMKDKPLLELRPREKRKLMLTKKPKNRLTPTKRNIL